MTRHRAEIDRRIAKARAAGAPLSVFVQPDFSVWVGKPGFDQGCRAWMEDVAARCGAGPRHWQTIPSSGTLIVAGPADFIAALLDDPRCRDASPCNLVGWPGREAPPRPAPKP